MYIGFSDGKYRYGVEGDAFKPDNDADLAAHNFGEGAAAAATSMVEAVER